MKIQRNAFGLTTALLSLLSLFANLRVCSAFIAPVISNTRNQHQHLKWQIRAVSEEEVLTAVESAEGLWADALKARESADKAAGVAEATQSIRSGDGDVSHLDATTISIAQMAGDIDLDVHVKKATEFSEEADRIEAEAEAALVETEKLLDQHLKDFPDSPLGDAA